MLRLVIPTKSSVLGRTRYLASSCLANLAHPSGGEGWNNWPLAIAHPRRLAEPDQVERALSIVSNVCAHNSQHLDNRLEQEKR